MQTALQARPSADRSDVRYEMIYDLSGGLTARVVDTPGAVLVEVWFWEPGYPGFTCPLDFTAISSTGGKLVASRAAVEHYLAAREAQAHSAFPFRVAA